MEALDAIAGQAHQADLHRRLGEVDSGAAGTAMPWLGGGHG
jgi:hypothetical protein